MKIVLTGGSGMVGRNILEQTALRDHAIYAPDSTELDLLDFEATRAYISRVSPDLIIHAAGLVGGIQANVNNPVRFLERNVAIGRNIIIAAIDEGVDSFINLASTCIYPKHGENPLSEESILTGALEPTNEGYALAKIVALKLCEYVERQTNKNYKTVIPCNLFGRFDNFDPGASHLLPAVIHKIHNAMTHNIDCVDIWGDGLARREFMYAGDLAEFLTFLINKLSSVPNTLNVGLGYDYSIDEYYRAVADVIGWKGEFTYDLSKPVGMQQKLSDVSRLNQLVWRPKTSLREGIERTYEFYLEKLHE